MSRRVLTWTQVKPHMCLCRIDSIRTSIHGWKVKVCTFRDVTLYPAATHKQKFFLLCRLISSSGDYYPSPFHSSGRVVAQLDEYLIWNVAFRRRWFVWKTWFRGLVGEDTWHKYKTSLMSLWRIKKVKKLYVYIFPTLTSASADWSGLSRSLCRTVLTRPYLEAFTPNTWPEATGKLTEALENKQPRRDGLFSSRLPIQMDAAPECADKDVPALERGAQTWRRQRGGK